MIQVNLHEAKTQLSRLVARVQAGEDVVIAKNHRPVARLVVFEQAEGEQRPLGLARGRIRMTDDFDAPLPEELLDAFEGKTS